MKKNSKFKALVLASFLIISCDNKQQNKQSDNETVKVSTTTLSPYEDKIDALLKDMNLEEKVGQTAQITLDVLGKGKDIFESDFPLELDKQQLNQVLRDNKVGSILNTATNTPLKREQWKKIIAEIQAIAVEATGIPVIYGVDAIHGTTYTIGATFFPQQIGMAATFNRELVYKGAQICAYETRASNVPWDFSPVLDMGRKASWPRFWETFGEDVYLTSELGMQMVLGYQGEDRNKIDPQHVASCLKHYMGYGLPFSGKDRTPAVIPENELIEKHYEPFVRAVEAGALSVMVNSGIINGESVHASHKIIQKMLKEDLKFDGVVVTDWQDINNLYSRDKIVQSDKEAIAIAINAGIDMTMIPYDISYCEKLKELVEEGKVSMDRLDDAVKRVLRLKFRLGLFDSPTDQYEKFSNFASDDSKKQALTAAEESITLLKNTSNILPLAKTKKVMITGPNAHSMRVLNGGWTLSWQGEKVDTYEKNGATFLAAIEEMIGKENVVYEAGVEYKMDGKYYEERTPNIDKAVAKAAECDVIIACVGENTYTEKPGDLDDLYLSDAQQALIQALAKTGKPIILVLNEGRPRIISKIEPQAAAVLHTYLPGSYGGKALAKILFGEVNPSGRLPFTYPKYPNALLCYDHKPSENQEKMEGAYDYESVLSVQYPFGYGLSYTAFKYSNLTVSADTFTPDDEITVTVDVANVGKVDGKESVLLFSSDVVATITPDSRRLRAFEKVAVKAGETQKVSLKVKASDLAYVNLDNQWIAEEGVFKIQVGDQLTEVTLTASKVYDNPFRK